VNEFMAIDGVYLWTNRCLIAAWLNASQKIEQVCQRVRYKTLNEQSWGKRLNTECNDKIIKLKMTWCVDTVDI